MPPVAERSLISLVALDRFCRDILSASGVGEASADAVSRVMMHGTRLGIDSHGVRLLPHYVTAFEGGRINKVPVIQTVRRAGAVETLDADNAHGALATYTAMENAVRLSGQFGIGAVAIRNSSHIGAAGAYSLEAAKHGRIGLTVCNSDSFVRLHDGAARFHGTNPISVAVPVAGQDPWLLDMATSSIPLNRVLLYRSLGMPLPDAVASDAEGNDTCDSDRAEMLAPLGGEFGYKGAALAGFAEILSAVLTGMKLSFDIASMSGPDFSTPRNLGAFVLAINPEAFIEPEMFDAGMGRYLDALRNSRARDACRVMAPGDREWRVAAEREKEGVSVDPATLRSFAELGGRYGIPLPIHTG